MSHHNASIGADGVPHQQGTVKRWRFVNLSPLTTGPNAWREWCEREWVFKPCANGWTCAHLRTPVTDKERKSTRRSKPLARCTFFHMDEELYRRLHHDRNANIPTDTIESIVAERTTWNMLKDRWFYETGDNFARFVNGLRSMHDPFPVKELADLVAQYCHVPKKKTEIGPNPKKLKLS